MWKVGALVLTALDRPYIIDLDSANGTMVNGDRIPPSRYLELRDKDMIQFGLSTREYVLMLPPAG
jgi:smad nuclear-interacting protein 1